MSKKRYIGLIHDERNDDFTIGYNISTNIKKMLKWKEKMLNCVDVEDCKIFEIKELKSCFYQPSLSSINSNNTIQEDE
tara:strand:+ start:957 stop:1190 length:234 start_codon:yes stop_codon:yes gene_type:complete